MRQRCSITFYSFACRRITTIMEGVLLKWTNYLSGWQPRWFILDNGVLSYYKSQEDVNNGCKGSIKMAVCDIVVHPQDNTRLDLIIPGEQHYYVKGASAQDRQSWLIALGSSKASFSDTSAAKKDADAMPDQMRGKKSELRLYCDLLMQQVHSVKQTLSATDGNVDVDKLNEASSLIGATCDTFIATLDDCMKLVSNTPMFEAAHTHVRDSAIPASPTNPNSHRLPGTRSTITRPENRSSRHRQSTSSQESIKIHNSGSNTALHDPSSSLSSTRGSIHSPTSTFPPVSPLATETTVAGVSCTDSSLPSSNNDQVVGNDLSHPDQDNDFKPDHHDQGGRTHPSLASQSTFSTSSPPSSSSVSSSSTILPSSQPSYAAVTAMGVVPSSRVVTNGTCSIPDSDAATTADLGDRDIDANMSSVHNAQQTPVATPSVLSTATSSEDLENLDDYKDAIDEPVLTFFSTLPASFAQVDTSSEEGINANIFLEACRSIVPMFDKLNSTAFAPVKMDFCGNIKKVEAKQESRPDLLTLEAMILSEVEAGTQRIPSSATSATLWLGRSLEFIREFLRECNSSSEEMSVCAGNAYVRTLKRYHGWVVRGVFTVAVKALPYRETFMYHLAVGDNVDTTSRHFEHTLMSDIELYVQHLDRVLTAIHDFYANNNLERNETV